MKANNEQSSRVERESKELCDLCTLRSRLIAAVESGGMEAELVEVVAAKVVHGEHVLIDVAANLLRSVGIEPPVYTRPPTVISFRLREHGRVLGLNALIIHDDGSCHLLGLRENERTIDRINDGPLEHVMQAYETGMLSMGLAAREQRPVVVARGGEA